MLSFLMTMPRLNTRRSRDMKKAVDRSFNISASKHMSTKIRWWRWPMALRRFTRVRPSLTRLRTSLPRSASNWLKRSCVMRRARHFVTIEVEGCERCRARQVAKSIAGTVLCETAIYGGIRLAASSRPQALRVEFAEPNLSPLARCRYCTIRLARSVRRFGHRTGCDMISIHLG